MKEHTEFKNINIKVGDSVIAITAFDGVCKGDIGKVVKHRQRDGSNHLKGIGIWFGKGEFPSESTDPLYWWFNYDSKDVVTWIKLYKKDSTDIIRHNLKSLEGILPDVYGREEHKKWLKTHKTIV